MTPCPFPLLADVLQCVEGVGVGHQADPWEVCLALENLPKDDLLQLKHGDRLLHHHLQENSVREQNLQTRNQMSFFAKPTSKLNLSHELLLESDEEEERFDTVLERTGDSTTDPWHK